MHNIAFLIEVMIETYYQESGRRPAGIILGPPQYRQLCAQVQTSPDYLKQAAVEGAPLTEYKGFPLFVKELPGIDLMIPYQEAFSAAYR